jgi:PAT family beta-lactamase induction signal transducer AmpG
VRASVGTVATIVGIAAGGFSAIRFGYLRTVLAGIVLKSLVIANFATLAWVGTSVGIFSSVMFLDNFGIGFGGVALVTYMSTLTSVGYTATQYALLSSTYTWLGKFTKGFSA